MKSYRTQSIRSIALMIPFAFMIAACGGDASDSAAVKKDNAADQGRVRFANPGPNDDVRRDAEQNRLGRSIWEKLNWKKSKPANESRSREKSLAAVTGKTGISIPVLCYHQTYAGSNTFGGYNVQPRKFEAQLKYLKEQGYQSVSLRDFEAAMNGNPPADFPKRPILLTFDDGLTSNETTALPPMRKYGFKGVLFIYPTIINSKRKNYMRWPAVRRLAKSGVFEIGSHTYWHAQLPAMSRADIRVQLRKSREILESKLGVSITALAYPFGLYDRRVIEEARAAGYNVAFTINPGSNQPGDPPYTLNRYMVTGLQSMRNFRTYLGLQSPRGIAADPPDGSMVRTGQSFILSFPEKELKELRVYLRGKRIAMRPLGNGSWSGRLRFRTRKNRRYMNMVIRARDSDGVNRYRRMLFLDSNRFKTMKR